MLFSLSWPVRAEQLISQITRFQLQAIFMVPHLLRLYSWRQRKQDAATKPRIAMKPRIQKQSTVLLPYRVHERGPAAIRLAAATFSCAATDLFAKFRRCSSAVSSKRFCAINSFS
jgi:hypothetical protein